MKVRLGATEFFFAENGLDALRLIIKERIRFRDALVILLDIQMPEMDGFQFLEAYELMDQQLKNVTSIYMLSSTIDPEEIERAEKHDFVVALLGKPLLTDELIPLLKRH